MSKVMLVMDKPKSCMFCPLLDGEIGECKEGGIIDDGENPTKCPLRPLPARKKFDNQIPYEKSGWNDCLDAILGEDE